MTLKQQVAEIIKHNELTMPPVYMAEAILALVEKSLPEVKKGGYGFEAGFNDYRAEILRKLRE